MLGGDWPTESSQVHLPAPLASQIPSPAVTGRAVVQDSALALLAGHGLVLRRQSTGDKGALVWHSTAHPAFASSPAVLATALNYSLTANFATMLECFEIWRNRQKIVTFIFKSKIKLKLFIAKLRGQHNCMTGSYLHSFKQLPIFIHW